MQLFLFAILVVILQACASTPPQLTTSYNPLDGEFSLISSQELVLKNAPSDQLQAFVSGVIGQQKNAWWTINQEQTEGNRQVMDITIHIGTGVARFIIGMKNGQIEIVKNVEPEAEVDCQHEGESFKDGS